MSEKHRRPVTISRRKVLAATGAMGIGTIAGCLSSDDNKELLNQGLETVAVDYNENYEEEMNEAVPGGAVNPYNGEYIFNPYHSSWNPGDAQETSFEYLLVYSTEEGGFIPRVAKNWQYDAKAGSTRVDISDKYSWSDGSQITSADFVTALKLQAYLEQGLEIYVDPRTITTDGDYAFQMELRDEYHGIGKDLWLNQWAETLLNVSEAQYGQFIERFESGDDKTEQIQQDVVSFEPKWDQVLFSGPFVFVEANEEYADQVPNPEHPVAQDWEFYLRHGQAEDEEGLRAGDVDWAHNNRNIDDLPKKYDVPPVSYSGQSFALLFGPEDEYIRDIPKVRQAIAHAIDFETLANELVPDTSYDRYSCGIDAGYVDLFVAEEVLEAMTNYIPPNQNRAARLLEDAGFTRDDGAWYTPDDERWELNFPVGDWFRESSEMIYNSLDSFGIKIDHYIEEMTTWKSEVEDGSKYDISVHLNYGMARKYHAYSDLQNELFGPTRGAVSELGLFDNEVEVPEVGNSNGDMITVNLEETLSALATTKNNDKIVEHATKLAWAHNYLLPGAMVHPWSEHYWVNVGDWNFNIESNAWLTSNRITHYFLEHGLAPSN
ncbi:ABC transporter substrate-binding protein [Halocatena pleomorpha]|uniref:ABC transporter substrate-binding protein n=1 Tax=Halocatena pleomorpha TaxID=1785090 RepID=A0A3P3RDI5_9EURY|nr:ABC transporter substrate-binding protein [Halocatena pleomorpha]RRJ31577.1 ABC transporter substrate-binding protein [Halocatena pleomorpha]